MAPKDPMDADNCPETVAGTTLGAGGDDTEIVPPLLTEPPPVLAWSTDDADSGPSWGSAAERASIIVMAAAAVAVVVGLVTWLGFYLYDQHASTHAQSTTSTVMVLPASMPTAAAPPPAAVAPTTVTVTQPPVTVQAAPPAPRHDDIPPPQPGSTDVFTICPDGHEGVVGGHTSCAFAESVRQTFYGSGMPNNFTAFSPATGRGYEMTCVGRYPAYFQDGSTKISTRCYAGENAEVVIW